MLMHISKIKHGLSVSEHVRSDSVLLNGLFIVHLRTQTIEVIVTQLDP